MSKTRFLIVGALSALLTTVVTQADESAARGEEFSAARELLQMGRKDIIRDEIRFSEGEAAAFWPAYDAYRNDIQSVRNRQADVVIAYLQAYQDGAVTDADAEQLIDDALTIKNDLLRVQQKHLKHFRKLLPAWKVARFYQLENKLDAELDVQLARFVPLMDPT